MGRRGLLVLIWLFGMVAATFVGWNAVHTVAAPPDEEHIAQQQQITPAGETGLPAERRTFPARGGTVAVRCSGQDISLDYATPEAGFAIDVGQVGPEVVSLRFRGEHGQTTFTGRCEGGLPVGQTGG